MTEKPPVWADWLLTLWVVAVGVFYFGGYFLPAEIGRYTSAGAAIYALLLLISIGVIGLRYLRRTPQTDQDTRSERKDTRT